MVAAPVRVRPVRLARAHALIDAVEAGWVVLLAAAAFWMLLVVAFLPVELVQDSYLALVSGREVALHGLPQHDALTIWTLGARWIDQQWLGQLFYYGLARVGGIRMVSRYRPAQTRSALRRRPWPRRAACWRRRSSPNPRASPRAGACSRPPCIGDIGCALGSADADAGSR